MSTELEQRLVDAGVTLLAETSSPESLSIREIARRAGVSHGAPRRYFPTHQSLLAAIALRGYARLGAAVAETIGAPGADPRTALLTFGRRFLDFARAEPGMFALMFRHDLLTGNGVGLRQATTPLFGVLTDLLKNAGRPAPEETAAALWSALHGLAQLWQWGTLQVVTGLPAPDPILTSIVDAHLDR